MKQTFVPLLAMAALAGCAAFPLPGFAGGTGASACPQILRADAWRNRMPGPDKRDSPLIVSLQVDSKAPWTLQAEPGGDPAVLTLALRPDGPGVAGNAAYREGERKPARQQVRITCEGTPVHTIDEITDAY